MEIRYITKDDNPLEISKIYESSWKYAYKTLFLKTILIVFQRGNGLIVSIKLV